MPYLDIKYLNVAAFISISVVIYCFQLDRCFTIQVALVAIENAAFFRQWRGACCISDVLFFICAFCIYLFLLKAFHLSAVILIVRTKELGYNRLRQI